jgi:hypothetical protein
MKLTNAEILNLFQALTNLNMAGNPKFSYTVAKNKASLKSNVEALQEAGNEFAKNSERFKDYQKKGDELIKTYSVDAAGKPMVRDSGDGQSLQRIIPAEKMGDFTQARQLLDEEYKDVILAAQAHQAAFQTLLREETEVDLRTVALKDVPENGLNTQIMNLIFVFIEDGETELGTKTPPLKLVPKNEPPVNP